MCTSNNFQSAMLPYGLKVPGSAGVPGLGSSFSGSLFPGSALDLHRAHAAQLYDYGARIRLGLHYAAAAAGQPTLPPLNAHPHDPFGLMYAKHCDPRLRFLHEEPKPSHSYIGLIAMAILSAKEKKMVLSDIYQWILDNYAYFRTRGPGWRNSIRHNLSLNDCFIKSGRSANGKGHYWAIHPANVDDFTKGDFRRRRAQRKVRKAMGLAVPDEEDSPSPPPSNMDGHAPSMHWTNRVLGKEHKKSICEPTSPREDVSRPDDEALEGSHLAHIASSAVKSLRAGLKGRPRSPVEGQPPSKRRLFDVDSLLAPDSEKPRTPALTTPTLTFYNPLWAAGSASTAHLFHQSHLIQKELPRKDLERLAAHQHPFSFSHLVMANAVASNNLTNNNNVPNQQSSVKELSESLDVSDVDPNLDVGLEPENGVVISDERKSPISEYNDEDGHVDNKPEDLSVAEEVNRIPGVWPDRPSAFRATESAGRPVSLSLRHGVVPTIPREALFFPPNSR